MAEYNLKPNANPNSEFGRWIREERRRGWEGLVNPETGMWITGDHYWLMNYCPIHMVVKREDGLEMRSTRHSKFWDGQFLMSHYVLSARMHKHHAAYLASRGKGKTSFGAATLAKRFIIGESAENRESVQCMVTAADRTKLIGTNQILDVFIDNIDFCAKHTQFASRRLKSSKQELEWEMGYKKSGSDVAYGSQNSVSGIISGVNQDKLNGSRGVLYLVEEAGIFKDLLSMYNMIRPSVEQGSSVFGEVLMYGTAGDDMSDFTAFQEIFYSPEGYNMEPLDNVFDKEGQGRKKCCMFYPAYLNYDDSCVDENGNSDVTKALLMLLMDRYKVKYGSTDVNTITKRISQYPITPQEAIIRSRGNMFPVTELNARLNEIDNNPTEYNDVYVGELTIKDNKVEFVPTGDIPIRDFPTKDNKVKGAVEIFSLPQKTPDGTIPRGRYIAGADPYDNDVAESMSLGSFFMLDTWTDSIVMEYTGRPDYADDYYEICRRACIFYNATLCYEAHPYSQKVYTPNGLKTWEDIKIGDELFAPNGKKVTVTDIPVDEYMPIYKVTLADGRVVEASDNHIWNVYQLNKHVTNTINLTTKQMLEFGIKNKHNQNNFFIPNGGSIEYNHQEVPIDPYTMGLLLAEGAFTKFVVEKKHNKKRNTVQFSSSTEDADFYKKILPYPIKYIGKQGFSWHLYKDDIESDLRNMGLIGCNSYSKFIPDIYLFNDYETRLELLKGLMDGDGCASKTAASIFITTSEKLKDDFMLLCRSLGFNCSCGKRKAATVTSQSGAEVHMHEAYRVIVFTNECLFKLPRKIQNQHVYVPNSRGSKANAFINKTAIVSIEYSHHEQGKCVTVDSEDGLYLVGDYVVTHNCNKKGLFGYFSQKNSVQLLADTPEYLLDKQLIKGIGYGNTRKGVTTTVPIKEYGFGLIRDWLLMPVTRIIPDAEGNDEEITIPNLYNIRSRALLKELILFHPQLNVDRIMALCMLMIYRQEKMVLFQGDMKRSQNKPTGMEADDYWRKNYPGLKQSVSRLISSTK